LTDFQFSTKQGVAMRHQDTQRRLMSIPSPWFDQRTKEGQDEVPETLPTQDEVAAVRIRCESMYQEQVQVRRGFNVQKPS
jgi:hypothetical protein